MFQSINFLVLAGFLSWLLFRPVRAALEERRAAWEKQAAEAQARLNEADQMRGEIARQRSGLDAELTHFRAGAEEAAQKDAARIREEAHQAARRELEDAKRDAQAWQRGELDRLSSVVAEAAGTAVERLLEYLSQPDLQQALVQAVCQQLTHREGPPLTTVRIESAQELAPEHRSALQQALGDAATVAEFQVTPGLGYGLRVTTNNGLIDATSLGLADFVGRELGQKLSQGEQSETTRTGS